jgi:predicted nucleic acid-binding Zn ribbon protein
MAAIWKQCEFCGSDFEADPRVASRQRACQSLSCQQQRKRQAQQTWVAKNPDYFKGRYAELKRWLADHPGYLKAYRTHKRQPCDIQDEISPEKTVPVSVLADIQDELTACVDRHLPEIDMSVSGDIQDELIPCVFMTLLILIYKTRLHS